MARLRRVSSGVPGIVRHRHGRGFRFVHPSGRPVRDPETLTRICALAIPPAWTDVWICPDPLGHLQAMGTDAAGRRQYRYHDAWRARRDAQKFDRMLGFARGLPALRERVVEDLRLSGVPRERVLAGAVRLLDQASFRVGSESYARDNGSFGLATLRKEHVHLRAGTAVFDFEAKSGQRLVQEVANPDVVPLIRTLKRRRTGGPELLAYREGDVWRDVRSADVNAYVKEVAGDGYSAKDFRTWHGTVVAAVALALAEGERTSVTSRRRQVSSAIRDVAEFLGNTPAVARASYVDPRVIDRFEEGVTIAPALERSSAEDLDDPAFREVVEAAVLDLLEDEESTARAA
ncbi:MAG TPA: DNA topoisomerase IB [Actinomycetota bacterium]|nr:DNA topoisomerase IB [Actinomycetota bacterium]